jgi:hypothetical protein
MKKLLFIAGFICSIHCYGQRPQMKVLFVDSAFMNQISPTFLPQVAISGYFDNLLHLPTTITGYGITDAVNKSTTLTINGTTQDLSTNRSWTVSSAVAPMNTLSKTANYTIASGDFGAGKAASLILSVDATSGNNTQTLPSAVTFAGYTIYVVKTDATANVVTLSGVSGNNTLGTQNQSRTLISTGTTWINN